jgi:hypothetical protein
MSIGAVSDMNLEELKAELEEQHTHIVHSARQCGRGPSLVRANELAAEIAKRHRECVNR